jgi:hypothetical protein
VREWCRAVEQTGVVGDGYDVTALWRWVDELTGQLSAADRRAIRDAVAAHLTHGRQSSHTDIADLVAYATGSMSMAHYLTITTHRRAAG